MKIDSQATADLRKLGDLLDGIEVAMLTTRAADGSMVSRPLQTLALDGNGELVFFTAADSGKIGEVETDPEVNLAYAHPVRDCYISVRGRARISRERATIDELWSATQLIFFPQGKDDPNLAVLRVRVRDATYWEPAGNFIARALDFARGMLDDEPSDLGRHGRLRGKAG